MKENSETKFGVTKNIFDHSQEAEKKAKRKARRAEKKAMEAAEAAGDENESADVKKSNAKDAKDSDENNVIAPAKENDQSGGPAVGESAAGWANQGMAPPFLINGKVVTDVEEMHDADDEFNAKHWGLTPRERELPYMKEAGELAEAMET